MRRGSHPHPLNRPINSGPYPETRSRLNFDEPFIDPDPLKRVLPSAKVSKMSVVIDYGHGGQEKDAKAKADLWEKDINSFLKELKPNDGLAQLSSIYSSPQRHDSPPSHSKRTLPFDKSYIERSKCLSDTSRRIQSPPELVRKRQNRHDSKDYRSRSPSSKRAKSRSPLSKRDRSSSSSKRDKSRNPLSKRDRSISPRSKRAGYRSPRSRNHQTRNARSRSRSSSRSSSSRSSSSRSSRSSSSSSSSSSSYQSRNSRSHSHWSTSSSPRSTNPRGKLKQPPDRKSQFPVRKLEISSLQALERQPKITDRQAPQLQSPDYRKVFFCGVLGSLYYFRS